MSLLMYKYRIYPSGKQKIRLINSFKICKTIYNELLGLNKTLFTTNKYELNGLVVDLKLCNPELRDIHSQVLQNVSDRVHKAFSNFFRRVKDKSCKEKGFPRFKSRVNSITFPQSGFKLLSDRRIRLSKIGNVPIVLHRVPKGKIKTLTIKQNKARQWFAIFACEMPEKAVVHTSKEKVGIDVGIESFATLSNGEFVANPRYLIKAERRLKLLQRRLSRKVKGSVNRRKARFLLAKQHLKVANQRTDFLHKLSHRLAKTYSFIAVEDLKISNMLKNHILAKGISDAGWGTFINMLSYKAVTCGGQLVKNPRTRGSSHRCNVCGEWVDMPLSKRTFKCPKCLNVCHRDVNASRNHIKDTVGLTEISTPVDDCVRPSLVKAVVCEAGTITTKPSTSSVVGSSTLQCGEDFTNP